MTDDASSLKPCVSCGALVPELQAPPYQEHRGDCALVAEWVERIVGKALRFNYLRKGIDHRMPLDRNIEDMLTFLSVFAPNLHHVLIGGPHSDKCRQDAYEELQILLNRREIK